MCQIVVVIITTTIMHIASPLNHNHLHRDSERRCMYCRCSCTTRTRTRTAATATATAAATAPPAPAAATAVTATYCDVAFSSLRLLSYPPLPLAGVFIAASSQGVRARSEGLVGPVAVQLLASVPSFGGNLARVGSGLKI